MGAAPTRQGKNGCVAALIRFQGDADLRYGFVKALRLREPTIDFASAADTDLDGLPDPEVLEIAAQQDRILVSHDRRTMVDHFRTRLAEGKSSPVVFLVPQSASIGQIVEVIVLVWVASEPVDWANQMRYLPSMSRHFFPR